MRFVAVSLACILTTKRFLFVYCAILPTNSVVIAVEKRLNSPLLVPTSVEKIMQIDEHLGCAMSGLTADARTLIDHARVEAQHHRFVYDEPLSPAACTQALCDLALRFGEDGRDEEAMSRPFGVALLVAGVGHDGPRLYHADPSGTFVRWRAKAIGAGSEGAQTALQEAYAQAMTLEEAETLALRTLKQVMEEKLDVTNVEVAAINSAEGKFHIYTHDQLKTCISRL